MVVYVVLSVCMYSWMCMLGRYISRKESQKNNYDFTLRTPGREGWRKGKEGKTLRKRKIFYRLRLVPLSLLPSLHLSGAYLGRTGGAQVCRECGTWVGCSVEVRGPSPLPLLYALVADGNVASPSARGAEYCFFPLPCREGESCVFPFWDVGLSSSIGALQYVYA